jgi:AraC-like DNA-binding protein
MYGVLIESCKAYKCDDLLQTVHSLELVLTGSIEVRYAGTTQILKANEIQIRRRGNYQLFPSADYGSLLIFMENEFVNNFLELHITTYNQERFSADLPPFVFGTSDFINANRAEIIMNIVNPQEYSRCIVRFTTHQILLQILAGDRSKNFVSFLRNLVSDRKIDLAYFMESNFNRQMSLADMAKLTGRSISAFKKEFTERFNTTPVKWQINRRLEYAEYQIKTSCDPVSMIAYTSGFENVSHFSKIYKQKFGLPPNRDRSIEVI